jgi:outer membrane receptor protein involved in Fe transport
MYIDGIPLVSKSQMNFHTYQLERIDILRGPQGTLYGMNTEGGLVRMYSRNPLTYQGTDVKLGIGSRFYRNVEAAHYHRFSSQLAMSVAGFYQGQNGFFRNTTTGRHADRYDEAGAKVRLVYLPTDRLTFDFIADYQYVNQKGFPYGVMDPESGKTANPESNRMGIYRRNMLNTGVNIKYVANGFDLHSTTSYQFLRDKMGMDIDYTAADRMFMQQKQLQNAITEEISLKSNTKSRWQWTTGVFTSYQWLRTDAPVYFYKAMSDAISQQIYNTIYQAAYNGQYNAMYEAFMRRGMSEAQAAAQAEAITKQSLEPFRFNITMDEEIPGTFHTPQFNLGLFHESNISLTDRLVATLGLRYDLNHVRMNYETRSGARLDINTTYDRSSQYH